MKAINQRNLYLAKRRKKQKQDASFSRSIRLFLEKVPRTEKNKNLWDRLFQRSIYRVRLFKDSIEEVKRFN